MNAGRKAYLVLGIVIVVAGVFLRFDRLALKPMHHDEGVNHLFVETFVKDGLYQYNPENYHGPLLYELAYLPAKFLGDNEVMLRAVPALLGTLVVVLILAMHPWIGRRGALVAAAITALSPADVYFSRTFIHEIYLVFTLALFAWFMLRFLDRQKTKDCVGALCALSLAFAVKETAALSVAVIAAAYAAAVFLGRKGQSPDFAFWKTRERWPVALLDAAMAAVILWMMFFSTFTTNPKGMADFFLAFMPWLHTGVSETGHEKEFGYFLALSRDYYRPALILVLPALIETIRRKKPVMIFFVVWTLGHFLVYSLIPYKTPWCAVTMAFPLVITAGMGAGAVFEWIGGRTVFQAAFAMLVVILMIPHARFCYDVNFEYYDNDRYKIVYVQTLRKFKEMFPEIEAIAKLDAGLNTPIVLIDAKHPMNFYLRDYAKAAYYPAPPAEAIKAPMIVAGEEFAEITRDRLDATYVEKRYPVWPRAERHAFSPGRFVE